MAFTKNDIAHSIYKKLVLPKNKSREAVESLPEIMKRALGNRKDVLISGFGKFSAKDKRERIGRNPHTEKIVAQGQTCS